MERGEVRGGREEREDQGTGGEWRVIWKGDRRRGGVEKRRRRVGNIIRVRYAGGREEAATYL
eukprot:6216098-Heterocapsa_arctica.AAC.1